MMDPHYCGCSYVELLFFVPWIGTSVSNLIGSVFRCGLWVVWNIWVLKRINKKNIKLIFLTEFYKLIYILD